MKMNKAVYDTRFFVEFFYSKDKQLREQIREEKRNREKFVSTITIHELYKVSLVREGRETAKLRAALIKKEFQIIPVDDQIAQTSADLRHKYNLSMGDSMIAATALGLDAVCISDDPHFMQIKEIKTAWLY
jgi:predicted nucleic acid-binding protein